MKEIQSFLERPRYLRAIPSLVILTTAMAWGALPDIDVSEDVGRRAGSAVSQRAAALQADLPGFLAAQALRRS